MNDKRNQYWLWAAIGLLLCLNVGTIGWIFRKTEPLRINRTNGGGNAEAFLPNRLGFDKQQRFQYRQYRQELRQAIRPHEVSLRQLRADLFARLQAPTTPTEAVVDSLVDRMNAQTGQLTRLRFRQWRRVRELCTPAQRPAFDELMTRLRERLNRIDPNATRERRRKLEKNNQ
ncbi:Spy/CpxP family protein refolding chaperone [Spirosoma utsteinense]|uniref:Membrane protein n=1 Tax=Spirosoma utsteinense TaxID=2585773 RepID=A0ABR6WF43_9BACT|nr:periplasmic heavy metal sensor [Spirosoma utsteinense]MBC3788862.1 putative membrane protein [Spirosoma utsteinense]MBC3794803.1 putative membrane protein [Spirosoma utsteinense]